MSDLVLLRPFALLLLLPLLALAMLVRYRRIAGGWAAQIDPALLPALRRMGLLIDGRGNGYLLLPFAAAVIMVAALAGPAAQRPGSIELRELDPIILMLDLSPSVVADPQALGALQAAAAEILPLAGTRPVGMMVYAADGYLASTPTTDAMSLQGTIAVLDRDTVPVAGSRPDIALSMARDLFTSGGAGIGGADLVVISDGGGTGFRAAEEAARLRSDGARVWALALARNAEGAPAPSLAGLEELARSGGGAALAASEVPALMDRIAAARTARFARDETASLRLRDFGPWLLPLAMVALLPLFRRRR
ncbi:VWA domain-containing protein [Paracoccus caeni]|uniref:VWA domain-containing protein n=1 Tax=Paracoccus caeni TaxID=657651 RepID=A0A934W1M6_9RHOB|nr:VWA domain-containing protein [Paracoccus caeni]MBK4218190.1 VWA domain-containing protein [Paracoccus caeni]